MNPSSPSEMPSLNLPTPDIQQNRADQTVINPEIYPGIDWTIAGSRNRLSMPPKEWRFRLVPPTYYSNPWQNISLSQPYKQLNPITTVTDIPASARRGNRSGKRVGS